MKKEGRVVRKLESDYVLIMFIQGCDKDINEFTSYTRLTRLLRSLSGGILTILANLNENCLPN